MLACLWVGVSRSSFLVVGVFGPCLRVGTPTTIFVLFVVCLGGGCWDHPPFFCVFMGRLLLKVVKDTPAIRRQTY